MSLGSPRSVRLASFSAIALAAAVPLGAGAQQLPVEGPVPTSAVVRVEGAATAPPPQSFTLELNGRQVPVESVTPLRQEGAELAILIDDGLRSSVGVQLKDVQQFITQLPRGVRVLVGYMQNGTVRSQAGFTADHPAAAAQVRIPFAAAGMSASPYLCLSDFTRHWPSQQRAARIVLMITNGVDPYNGSTSVMNQDSPYVRAAQEDAQRAGVAVYALYYGDAGMRGSSASFSGQSYLTQVAEATGGDDLYTGNFSPPSFAPFLKQLDRDLAESFVLGFHANATRERTDTLVRLKVRSTTGAKVHAPQGVHPGVVE